MTVIRGYRRQELVTQSTHNHAKLPQEKDGVISAIWKKIAEFGNRIKDAFCVKTKYVDMDTLDTIKITIKHAHDFTIIKTEDSEIDSKLNKTEINEVEKKNENESKVEDNSKKLELKEEIETKKNEITSLIKEKEAQISENESKIKYNTKEVIEYNLKGIENNKNIRKILICEKIELKKAIKELEKSKDQEDKKIKDNNSKIKSNEKEINIKTKNIKEQSKQKLLDNVMLYESCNNKIIEINKKINEVTGYHLTRTTLQKKTDEQNIMAYKSVIEFQKEEMCFIGDIIKKDFKEKLNNLEFNDDQKVKLKFKDQQTKINLTDEQIEDLELTIEQVRILTEDKLVEYREETIKINHEIEGLKQENLNLKEMNKTSQEIVKEINKNIEINNNKIIDLKSKIIDKENNIKSINELIETYTRKNEVLENSNIKLKEEIKNELSKL